MSTTARSERPIRRWISCVRPDLLARGGLAAGARAGGARQHAVFGGDPAQALAAAPARAGVVSTEAVTNTLVLPKLTRQRAFGLRGDVALERHGAHLVWARVRKGASANHSSGKLLLTAS